MTSIVAIVQSYLHFTRLEAYALTYVLRDF